MIRYDKPIIKSAAEMKPGDIFRTEYGDYDNWCEFVFERCNVHAKGCTVTFFHCVGKHKTGECYEYKDISRMTYTVVGREAA